MHRDVDDTVASIGRYSRKDGETWRRLAGDFVRAKDSVAGEHHLYEYWLTGAARSRACVFFSGLQKWDEMSTRPEVAAIRGSNAVRFDLKNRGCTRKTGVRREPFAGPLAALRLPA
jgi:hypothetical protein